MVSIIIPIYNSAKFLENCLESIVSQTFLNWECILIDDGSTDGSGAICDLWSVREPRFKVIHQENSGVSAARNRGLFEAKGEFVTFIDSDDWVGENYLFYLVSEYNNSCAEMVVSGVTHVALSGEQEVLTTDRPFYFDFTCRTDVSVRHFLDNIGLVYGPYSILYSKFIIDNNNIRFPVDRSLGEDIVFNFMYMGCINAVQFSPESHYYYRKRTDSLMSVRYPNRFSIHYSNWLCQKSFMLSKGLWNTEAQEHFGRKLWGIVYESLFMSDDRSMKMIRNILSMEDMDLMLSYSDSFNSSPWIKRVVASRNSFLIWGVVNFLKFIN